MTYNVALAEQTVQHILDNPECHAQSSWMCGSTGCYFGWAVFLDCHVNKNKDIEPTGYDDTYHYRGDMQHVGDIAQKLLGLNPEEACKMYDSRNTIEDLQQMVKLMANGESPLSYRGGL